VLIDEYEFCALQDIRKIMEIFVNMAHFQAFSL